MTKRIASDNIIIIRTANSCDRWGDQNGWGEIKKPVKRSFVKTTFAAVTK